MNFDESSIVTQVKDPKDTLTSPKVYLSSNSLS